MYFTNTLFTLYKTFILLTDFSIYIKTINSVGARHSNLILHLTPLAQNRRTLSIKEQMAQFEKKFPSYTSTIKYLPTVRLCISGSISGVQ